MKDERPEFDATQMLENLMLMKDLGEGLTNDLIDQAKTEEQKGIAQVVTQVVSSQQDFINMLIEHNLKLNDLLDHSYEMLDDYKRRIQEVPSIEITSALNDKTKCTVKLNNVVIFKGISY